MLKSMVWSLAFILTLASCSDINQTKDQDKNSDGQDMISEDIQDSQDGDANFGKMEGYIVFTKDRNILLIEDPDFNQEDIHLPVKELQRKYHGISYLYEINDSQKKNMESGQKVRIGARMILESHPAKVYVSSIEIIED